MTEIQKNLNEINNELVDGCRLVAISKYHPAQSIQEAYDAGQRVFGESHVQEIEQKVKVLPSDIEWHFIGHLQTNKVKYIAPYISLIHAVDSEKLFREINKQAAKCNRNIKVLIQLHVAQEETKFGFTPDEAFEFLGSGILDELSNVTVAGVMGMTSNIDDEEQIRGEFKQIKAFFDKCKQTIFANSHDFKEISMGMSHDYKIAMQEGSTMIRVGTRIFGARVY